MATIDGRRMVWLDGAWADYENLVAKTGERIVTLLGDGPKNRRYLGGCIGRDRVTARLIDTALRRLEQKGAVRAWGGPVVNKATGRTWSLVDHELEARKAREREESRRWAAAHFGVPVEDVEWYHSGICFATIAVRTLDAVERVRAKVKGETVNGGWFDGAPLGATTMEPFKDGTIGYRVTC